MGFWQRKGVLLKEVCGGDSFRDWSGWSTSLQTPNNMVESNDLMSIFLILFLAFNLLHFSLCI